MYKIILPLLIIGLGLVFLRYCLEYQESKEVVKQQQNVSLLEQLANSSDVEKILEVLRVEDFGEHNNKVLKFKTSLLTFADAEKDLRKLQQITALRGFDETHPVVVEEFKKVVTKYNRAKELIDQCDWDDYSCHYIRGCIYFRQMVLKKDKDMKTKALESFKKALQKRPKDLDTEVAIELLIQKGNGLGVPSDGNNGPPSLKQFPGNSQNPPSGAY